MRSKFLQHILDSCDESVYKRVEEMVYGILNRNKMENKEKPYSINSSKFLGQDGFGGFTYEITFNQSLHHTGRFKGIEDGLNAYRENEIKEYEEEIIRRAEEIKERKG